MKEKGTVEKSRGILMYCGFNSFTRVVVFNPFQLGPVVFIQL